MIIVKRGLNKHLEGVVLLANAELVMSRMTVDGVGDCIATVVGDDHPLAAAIRVTARRHPHYKVMPRGVRAAPTDALVKPGVPDVEIGGLKLLDIAMKNGWAAEDVAGADPDQPGIDGGRSPTSGLTLADMVAIRAPENWDEHREVNWPWELADWKPPVATWPTPVLSSKGRDDGDEDSDEDEEAPNGVLDDATDDEASNDGDEVGTPDDAGVPEDEAPNEPNPGTPQNVTEGTGDPAAAAGYPEEHVAAARILAHSLLEAKGGSEYHPNALNFGLRKADLPTVNAEKLAGLLAVAP